MSDEPGFGPESRSTVEACACGNIAVARTAEGILMCNKGISCQPFLLNEARKVAEALRDGCAAKPGGLETMPLPWETQKLTEAGEETE